MSNIIEAFKRELFHNSKICVDCGETDQHSIQCPKAVSQRMRELYELRTGKNELTIELETN